MKRVIDLLFVVGLLINFTKGADLLLRADQQKWIQNKAETLALWLEYASPLRWYRKLTTNVAHTILSLLAVALYSLTWFYIFRVWETRDANPYSSVSDRSAVIIILALQAYSSYAWITHPLVKWLLSNDKLAVFMLKFVFISVGIFAGFVVAVYILRVNYGTSFLINRRLGIIGIMCFGAVMTAILAWLTVGIVFSLIILLYLIQILVLLSRAGIWRIVEYNKGAWAALTLLITIVLGCIELYLRGR